MKPLHELTYRDHFREKHVHWASNRVGGHPMGLVLRVVHTHMYKCCVMPMGISRKYIIMVQEGCSRCQSRDPEDVVCLM